jgi:hypothetical protein
LCQGETVYSTIKIKQVEGLEHVSFFQITILQILLNQEVVVRNMVTGNKIKFGWVQMPTKPLIAA